MVGRVLQETGPNLRGAGAGPAVRALPRPVTGNACLLPGSSRALFSCVAETEQSVDREGEHLRQMKRKVVAGYKGGTFD